MEGKGRERITEKEREENYREKNKREGRVSKGEDREEKGKYQFMVRKEERL